MYWDYPRYVSVAEKRKRAEKKLKQLRKKFPDLQPVILEGTVLAKTWWGKAWNTNLEKYADYKNRIGRGRNYIRHGSVLDLKIARGKIEALVLGSERQPYSIQIRIDKLTKKKWQTIKKKAKDKIDSLQELLDGKFPKELGEIFTAKGAGLFPAPKDIKMSCTCPDLATMCKHVAATLYGVGARLDECPELFFTLRGVNIDELISFAVEKRKTELFGTVPGKKKTSRVIQGDDDQLSALFDIDMADSAMHNAKPKTGKETVTKKRTINTKKARGKKASGKKVAKKKTIIGKKTGKKAPGKKVAKKKTIIGKKTGKKRSTKIRKKTAIKTITKKPGQK